MENLAKLVVFLPLISGVLNGIYCKKISFKAASVLASISILIAAVSATCLFFKAGVEKQHIHHVVATWISIDSLNINWAIYVDQLTAIMFLLVTCVSAVVHIYSLGYMADDKNLPKFLSYLSLFTFFMLSLVSADNFVQLFFGWEGVGLCSYLLIGYYYEKESANAAAVKAFIVNRVGDFAFIIGMVLIIMYTKAIDFKTVFAHAHHLANTPVAILGMEYKLLDIICLLLFIGCMGKSAQIGLHVWLPDAMEGPTPVSALIHAATMVTAGVFLVARCSFLFEYSVGVLNIIAIIGAVTCLFAALVAIAQEDIKKIIAYSTCSQLGYMFFACGVSAYQAGIFHLVTHGFFKALLFLAAGSVIHAAHEQDIFKMGGLTKKMPFTYASFWVGSLAIIGIFPFAGFYSKDLILESAYTHGQVGKFAFYLGILAAALTAVYSFKIIMLVFHGQTNLDSKTFSHAHESPKVMNVPLIVLIAGALFTGMIGKYILLIDKQAGFFASSLFFLRAEHHDHLALSVELLPLIVGISGALFGIYVYKCHLYKAISKSMNFLYIILKNKFFFDEIFEMVIVCPVYYLSKISQYADKKVIDRFGPDGFSVLTKQFAGIVSKFQTGYIFSYVFYIIFALIVCLTVFVWKFNIYMG